MLQKMELSLTEAFVTLYQNQRCLIFSDTTQAGLSSNNTPENDELTRKPTGRGGRHPPDVTGLCGMKKKMPGQLAGHVFDPGRGGGYRTHDPALIKHPL